MSVAGIWSPVTPSRTERSASAIVKSSKGSREIQEEIGAWPGSRSWIPEATPSGSETDPRSQLEKETYIATESNASQSKPVICCGLSESRGVRRRGGGVQSTPSPLTWAIKKTSTGFIMESSDGRFWLSESMVDTSGPNPELEMTSKGLGVSAVITKSELASGRAISIGDGIQIRRPSRGTVVWSNARGGSGSAVYDAGSVSVTAPGLGSHVVLSSAIPGRNTQAVVSCSSLWGSYDLAMAAETAAVALAITAPEILPADVYACALAAADAEAAWHDIQEARCV